ncbi:MAG: nucleotide exchange factor GrpE [Hyphomicrobiaceae bacterium]|nr:nucleotide exchange factor GrpE [Hyphomicrobiaceae bacterium]
MAAPAAMDGPRLMTDDTPQVETTEQAQGASIDALALAQAEIAELKDKLLRTLADMENLRRRTERDVKDARDYAVTGFARDLLAVGDNFERALTAIPAELAANDTAKPLIDGVNMTGRELLKVLEKHGVRKVEPQGQKFDPNLHQAMFEIPNPDVVAGTVMQVLQSGFVIGDRVLRPALVGVAKGGPKAAPAPVAPETSASVDKTV